MRVVEFIPPVFDTFISLIELIHAADSSLPNVPTIATEGLTVDNDVDDFWGARNDFRNCYSL